MTGNAEKIIEAFRAGWGGVVLETIAMDPSASFDTKSHEIRSGRVKWGRVETMPVSPLSLEEWETEIEVIRNSFPDHPLIASIYAGDSKPDWQELASRLAATGILAFEINSNFPNIAGADSRLIELGQDPEVLARVISWVREVSQLPVIVKLTPNVTDILPAAHAALEAGADGFTATGGLRGIGGIDFESFSTLPSFDTLDMAGTYSGPGLKPVALRWTAVLAKTVSSSILGSGGISTWQDAVEFFCVGAGAVQVGTAVRWHGIEMIHELRDGLEEYLEGHNYESPAELLGKALPNIVGFDELDLEYKLVATLDEAQCIDCDLCVRACNDGGFQAITMVDKIAKVDPKKCDGCGLCIYVCPPDIMNMVPMNQISASYQGDDAEGQK